MSERIKWLRDEGLLYHGMWEPVYFEKMRGGATDAVDKVHEWRHSEAFVSDLAERGVNQLWTHFFKGFGIEFEHGEMERNRELTQLCRDKGIRVIAYCTFGSLTPDTILLEAPEAAGWFQVNEEGRFASNQTGHQNFRVRPCYNARGWRDYMKTVTSKALEMGIDGIHFDNIGFNAEPDSCKCETCTRKFREFLTARYSGSPERDALGMARFGLTDFAHASLPWFNRWNQAINQRVIKGALQQEWVQFKIESLASALQEIADHIRSVKADALVEANAGKAVGVNTQLWHGICLERVYPILDLAFNESGTFALNEKGTMISRVREMKMGRAGGVPVIMYCRDEAQLAESLAFNQGCYAFGGSRELNDYFHQVKKYAARTESMAEIAVLFHAETMAYSVNWPYESFITVTQVLIERHIPFDIVYGSQLGDLSRYKVLVLPNVECLSDDEAAAIEKYVEAGGTVLATEDTGRYDLWRRQRVHKEIEPTSPEACAQMLQPKNALSFLRDMPRSDEPVNRTHGKGRASYIGEIEYVERMGTAPEVWMYDSRYWAIPNNADDFLEAFEYLIPDPVFAVIGRGKYLFEALRVAGTGEIALHLAVLNPDDTGPIEIDYDEAAGIKEAIRIDRHEGERPVDFVREGDSITVRLQNLAHHNLIVLR